jgi:hypothetical protein
MNSYISFINPNPDQIDVGHCILTRKIDRAPVGVVGKVHIVAIGFDLYQDTLRSEGCRWRHVDDHITSFCEVERLGREDTDRGVRCCRYRCGSNDVCSRSVRIWSAGEGQASRQCHLGSSVLHLDVPAKGPTLPPLTVTAPKGPTVASAQDSMVIWGIS